VPIIGVWDDHDFGADNSGKEYQGKVKQKEMYLDFIGEPPNSQRRLAHEGTYQDYYVIKKPVTKDE
jgi:alkaline phosphatase D